MSNLTSAKSSLIKILQTKKKEKLITLDSEKREFGLPKASFRRALMESDSPENLKGL